MKDYCFIGVRFIQNNYKHGNTYGNLQKTIVILIADFTLNGLEELEYFSSWKIIEEKTRKTILTEKLEICIIELPKITNLLNIDDELLDWLFFLDNPNSERVIEKMKDNKELKQAYDKLDSLSNDEHMRRIAEWREKAIISENTNLEVSYQKGLEQGLKQAQINFAIELLKKEMDINFIKETTGLSTDEISKLKNELKK